MEKHILLGDVDNLVSNVFAYLPEAIDSFQDSGYISPYVDSQFIDRLGSDLEALRNVYAHFNKRPDTMIITEMYSLICSIHDRVQLKWQHIATTDNTSGETQEEALPHVRILLRALRALRSRFLYDVRGRDLAATPKNPDGLAVRTNRHVKLDRHRILEKGRIGEID